MSQTCFHCGQPCRQWFPFKTATPSAACCAGCQAVAQTILDSGLGDYYRHRNAEARQADPLPDELLARLRLYDTRPCKPVLSATRAATVRRAGGADAGGHHPQSACG